MDAIYGCFFCTQGENPAFVFSIGQISLMKTSGDIQTKGLEDARERRVSDLLSRFRES